MCTPDSSAIVSFSRAKTASGTLGASSNRCSTARPRGRHRWHNPAGRGASYCFRWRGAAQGSDGRCVRSSVWGRRPRRPRCHCGRHRNRGVRLGSGSPRMGRISSSAAMVTRSKWFPSLEIAPLTCSSTWPAWSNSGGTRGYSAGVACPLASPVGQSEVATDQSSSATAFCAQASGLSTTSVAPASR